MKTFYSFLALMALVFTFKYFNPASGNSTGAPAGFTGSPADGNTCATSGCHSGGSVTPKGFISSNIPADGYIAGETYSITLDIDEAGRNGFGFSLTAEDNASAKAGSFVANDETQANGINSAWVTHRFNSRAGTDGRSWVADWVAPAAGTGSVTFYAAINAANNDGGTGGDIIYTANATFNEAASSSILKQDQPESLSFYPNPAESFIRFTNIEALQIRIFDLNGRLAAQYFNFSSQQLDISSLNSGLYFIEIEDQKHSFRKKLIKI